MSLDSALLKLEATHKQGLPAKSSSSSLSGQKPEAKKEEDPLAARIEHLDPFTQKTIKQLSAIQHGYAIRAYESEDGCRAGIIAGRDLRQNQPEIVKRFSRLFFGIHHSAICVVFKNELRAVGRKYRK